MAVFQEAEPSFGVKSVQVRLIEATLPHKQINISIRLLFYYTFVP